MLAIMRENASTESQLNFSDLAFSLPSSVETTRIDIAIVSGSSLKIQQI